MKMLLTLTLLALPAFAGAQSLSLDLSTVPNAEKNAVIPTLTWSATPEPQSCSASGLWSGNKPSSGSETLPATTGILSYALVCSWPGDTRAVVTWVPPTTNTDGTPYTNPAGFRLAYGTSPSNLNRSLNINDPTATTVEVTELTPGTWYFGVVAVNTLGIESDMSNVASKTTTGTSDRTGSVSLEVKTPNPPVLENLQ